MSAPYFRSLKYRNPHNVLVGWFTEGNTQKEADEKFFQKLPEIIPQLNQITGEDLT